MFRLTYSTLGASRGARAARAEEPARTGAASEGPSRDTRYSFVQANAQREYRVTPEDLPLSCPMPDMPLWNSHPRVYLPIEDTGWAMCPYCAAEYILQPNERGRPDGAAAVFAEKGRQR